MKNYITRKIFNKLRPLSLRDNSNYHETKFSLHGSPTPMSKAYKCKFLIITLLCFCFSSAAFAAEDLTQIENYLNNIKNLSAKFTQESEGGKVEGKFYLSRNQSSAGKMRVEYIADPKILIVVNGAVLSYYDVELDEISHLSTNTTPASLLTRPNISFSAKDIEVTKVEKESGKISISLVKKNRKDAGEFTLVFNLNPIQFVKMKVKNDLGQIVSVTLSDIDFNSEIANKMFVLRSKE